MKFRALKASSLIPTMVLALLFAQGCSPGKGGSGDPNVSVYIEGTGVPTPSMMSAGILSSLASMAGIEMSSYKASSAAPTSVTAFDCIAVNVMGPSIGAWDSNSATVLAGTGRGYTGIVGGTVSVTSGGTITVRVPAGSTRVVQILGMTSNVGCPTGVTGGDLESTDKFPGTYEVGRDTQSIYKDASIAIANNYKPSTVEEFRGIPTPGATGSITATAASASSIAVSWSAAKVGTRTLTSVRYKVVRAAAKTDIDTLAEAEAATTVMDWTTDATSTTATGLSGSTTYAFNVLVRDDSINKMSLYSPVTATTSASDSTAPTPGNSGTLATSGVTASQATVSWTAATDDVTAASSLEYKVVRALATVDVDTVAEADAATTVQNWTANITSATTTGLSAGTTYAFQVLVRDAAGNKAIYTAHTRATSNDTTAPTPGNSGTLATSGVTGSQVTLSWTAATDNGTAQASLEYKVVRASATTAIDTVAEADAATTVTDWTANITTTNATGLSGSTTYAFQVLVRDLAGQMAIYTATTATTLDAAPTVGGSGVVTVTQISGIQTQISWTAATDDITAQTALEYKIVYAAALTSIDTIAEADAATIVTDWTADITSTSLNQGGSATLAYNVLVRDAAGNKVLYAGGLIDNTAPTAGGGGTISVGTVTGTTVALSWTAATDNLTAQSSLEYKIVRGSATTAIDTVAEADAATIVTDWTANLTSTTATGLSGITTYAFQVLVRDGSSYKAIYTATTATTADGTAPTAGGSGTLSATPSQSKVGLVWTAATDNITSAASLQYKVVRASATTAIDTVAECDAATTVTDWTTNITNATVTSLNMGTAYAFNVIVRDAGGNEAIYTPISVTTNAAGADNVIVVAHKPSGVTSLKPLSKNSDYAGGFFFGGSFYQPVQSNLNSNFLVKLGTDGAIDLGWGTNGFLALSGISGAPSGFGGNGSYYWVPCNGDIYLVYSPTGATYNLLKFNVTSTGATITDPVLSTTPTSGAGTYGMYCMNNELYESFSTAGNRMKLVRYTPATTTYFEGAELFPGPAMSIPFLDGANLTFYDWGGSQRAWAQVSSSDLNTITATAFHANNNSVYLDGGFYASLLDFEVYWHTGMVANFSAGTVSTVMSNFTGGTATSTDYTFTATGGTSISQMRFCRSNGQYLGYQVTSVSGAYKFAAVLLNASHAISSAFNSGSELLLDFGPYTAYNGHLNLNIGCDDSAKRAVLAYQNASSVLAFRMISTGDATPPTISSSKIGVTSLGSTSVTLSWTRATDDTSAQQNLTYKVYRSAANPTYGSFGTIADVEGGTLVTTATDLADGVINSGLTNGASYYFNVIVSDEAGNKSVYSPVGEFIKSNLELFYPFNGNASDSSLVMNHGTLVGGPSLSNDRFGYAQSAYSFVDGQTLASTSNTGITGAAVRTVTFWIKLASATISADAHTFHNGTGGVNEVFGCYFKSGTNTYYVYLGSNDFDTGAVVTTNWEFWAQVYDGANVVVYKNGVQVASQAKVPNTGDSKINIGWSAGGGVDGLVDDFRLYSSALSATDVSNLYNVTKP